MALLVSDANIFIDFDEGGLLRELFQLPERIGVPDLLFEDELRGQHADLLELGLALLELAPDGVLRAAELARRHRRPSRLDLAALALAEQEKCPLLTGDRHLREAARAEGVDVHGTLWLVERLVTLRIVRVDRVRLAYERMRAAGRRLPWERVEEQVRRLGDGP